jgi:hypothetical protein
MSVTREEVQNGVNLKTSQGNRRVGGRVTSDGGAFVVLVDDDGVGSLVNEGALYDDEDVEVVQPEEDDGKDSGKDSTGSTGTTESKSPRPSSSGGSKKE